MAANPASPEIRQPLRGVRVLEFGHVAAGPFASSLLADLGADVVKVEPPGGDQMRAWPPLARDDDDTFSHNFAAVNRNKRSVAADLRVPEEATRVRSLCAAADVIVENYRPGVLDRLGFGFDEVSDGHRGMVYCSISGFGRASAHASAGAYDVVIQAMSGLMSVTGEPGRPPVKSGVPVADFVTGLYAAFTAAALLPQVRRTGSSVHVDCSMLDCMLGVSALQTSAYWGSGQDEGPLGSAHPRNAPYQAFSGSDRPFVLAAGNQRLWRSTCEVAGTEHLLDDPRFADQVSRVAHQGELAELLQGSFGRKPAAHWVTELRRRGVPVSLVNRFSEILSDEHVAESGLVSEVPVPIAGPTSMLNFPVRIAGAPGTVVRRPPLLGEHTDEVLADWTAPHDR
ncbi:CaiB/BaiF CoA transferase family protein [Nonomuraea insulae]|uniref:CaiB/BaiF CoA transferase family protein n=1 Tax=Nonomuraea insulae TaxID=1616787 RepID=A0ABW1DC66_9ACTN